MALETLENKHIRYYHIRNPIGSTASVDEVVVLSLLWPETISLSSPRQKQKQMRSWRLKYVQSFMDGMDIHCIWHAMDIVSCTKAEVQICIRPRRWAITHQRIYKQNNNKSCMWKLSSNQVLSYADSFSLFFISPLSFYNYFSLSVFVWV